MARAVIHLTRSELIGRRIGQLRRWLTVALLLVAILAMAIYAVVAWWVILVNLYYQARAVVG